MSCASREEPAGAAPIAPTAPAETAPPARAPEQPSALPESTASLAPIPTDSTPIQAPPSLPAESAPAPNAMTACRSDAECMVTAAGCGGWLAIRRDPATARRIAVRNDHTRCGASERPPMPKAVCASGACTLSDGSAGKP